MVYSTGPSGQYYKSMMILNDDSRVVNKLETSLTVDARVIIYDHHMFIGHRSAIEAKSRACLLVRPSGLIAVGEEVKLLELQLKDPVVCARREGVGRRVSIVCKVAKCKYPFRI
jgi:hypothetical protein